MAVGTPVLPLPKGEPDLSKLNTFSGHTVQVTKYLQPRGGMGTTILPPTVMPLAQILQLMSSLPLQHNSGFYKFTVTDPGGTGDDVWMTKLGPELPQETPMNGVPMNGTPPGPGAPTSEGVRHLGRGFTYDPELGVLTTPWGTAANWRPGEQLPTPPANAGSPAATLWAGAQGGPGGWGAPGGWGNYPVNDTESTTVRELKQQIADQARQREMDGLRADIRRSQEDTNKVIAALVDKITAMVATPTGPTAAERLAEARLAEEKQARLDAERRHEDARREEQRTREMQQLRSDFERAVREASANKSDPMLPLLMNVLTSSQTSATEAVKAIQAASATGATASERATQQLVSMMASQNIGPVQLISMLQAAKGDAAESAKTIMETSRNMIDMQRDVFTQMLEAAGTPNQPAWLTAVEKGLDKVGAIGAAIAERQAAAAQQPQSMQPPQMVRRQPVQQFASPPQAPRMGPMNGAAPAPNGVVLRAEPVADRPGAIQTGLRPEGTEWQAATETWLLPDGREIKNADVQTNGWRAVLAKPVRQAVAPAAQAVAPPNLTVVPPPAAASPTRRGKKRGKKDELPPPAAPEGYTAAQLKELSPEVVFDGVKHFNDEMLFGPLLLPYVQQMRTESPSPSPEQVATYVLEARGRLQGFGGVLPPAMELLEAMQLDVLVARLFPEGQPAYCDEVVAAIGNALEAEALGTQDDEEDDGEEEDDTKPAG